MHLPPERAVLVCFVCFLAISACEAAHRVYKSGDDEIQDIKNVVFSGQGSGARDNWNVMPDFERPPTLSELDLIYNPSRNTVPVVNEEYKLIFFLVAKAASSEWIRFLMRLEGL